MYSLEVIQAMNRNTSGLKVESETTRHCSYAVGGTGIVLHSAKKRNTVFLRNGRDTDAFYRKIGTKDRSGQDRVIESYFN